MALSSLVLRSSPFAPGSDVLLAKHSPENHVIARENREWQEPIRGKSVMVR